MHIGEECIGWTHSTMHFMAAKTNQFGVAHFVNNYHDPASHTHTVKKGFFNEPSGPNCTNLVSVYSKESATI